jgi:hypothetical protein
MDCAGVFSAASIAGSTAGYTQAAGNSGTRLATTEFVKKYAPSTKIQPVTATSASGALTITLSPTYLDFRSATASNGTVSAVDVPSAITLTVPSGTTLGATSGVQARLVVLAVNTSPVQLAVTNLASGLQLDETTTITTSTSGATITSILSATITTAAYRVVGFVDVTNTSGSWGTPAIVQGGSQFPTGILPITRAKAWVNFDGTLTGTITPRANYNIGSITKVATGRYTLNFNTALTDANYSVVGSCGAVSTTALSQTVINSQADAPTTTSVGVSVSDNNFDTLSDTSYVNVIIFGN